MLTIHKGVPDEAELAAVVAVLTLHPAEEEDDSVPNVRVLARWRRPERVPGFEPPTTWRSGCGGRLREVS
jgi:hypothetical protein